MSFGDAFNSLLMLQARPMVLKRLDGPGAPHTVSIRIAPSNYNRILSGPSSTSVEGYEFIISKQAISQTTFPTGPKKKDRIIDPDLGTLILEEIVPMFDFGGGVIGWRVRTG